MRKADDFSAERRFGPMVSLVLSYDSAPIASPLLVLPIDAAGNQVRALAPGGGAQRFQYDAANRLVKVKANDNQTVIASYTYGDSKND